MTVNNPILDIIVMPTYSPYTLAVGDYSQYPVGYAPSSPTIEITAPGYNKQAVSFVPKNLNLFNSTNMGITCEGQPESLLPDGLYTLKYTVAPAFTYFVTKTILRVDNIMERFDTAFMKLDITECDQAIKREQKIQLDTINYFIQCAIAAGNKCANKKAIQLYNQASKMLEKFNNQCQNC